MELFTVKKQVADDKTFIADDMLLTTDCPTCAGSRMLDGYTSLFEAEAITLIKNAGYEFAGKTPVGEFSFDLVGETNYNGALTEEGKLVNATARAIKNGDATVALTLDVNGTTRRGSAMEKLCSIKPTYGTVSRYGTIPVACSGETVSVTAKTSEEVRSALAVISTYDDKDGTSLPLAMRNEVTAPVKKVAVLTSLLKGINEEVRADIDNAVKALAMSGVTVDFIDDSVIALSRPAWNILMCAELCNNVSRYDGVKYGYRAKEFSGLDELYTLSRSQSFGDLLKTAIIYGSETLSTDNYMKVYDKALRTRRVIVNAFASIFAEYDAVLIPVCSTYEYTNELLSKKPRLAFDENFYTAPASISGLPAVVVKGVQLVGPAFSENALLDVATTLEKEIK